MTPRAPGPDKRIAPDWRETPLVEWFRQIYSVPRLRDWLLLSIVAFAVLIGWLGYVGGKPLFRRWKSARAIAQARAFLHDRDLANAQLALLVAFQALVTTDAYVTLADFLEQGESPEAVEARRLAAQSTPTDLALRLAWSTTALHFRDLASARVALAGCSAPEKKTEAYLRAAAAYALIAGEFPEADRLLALLQQLKGDQPELRLLHAAVRVNSVQPERAAAARADLRRLTEDPTQRLAALRVLLADALAKRDPLAAAEFAGAMSAEPTASFADWLNAAAAEQFAHPASGPSAALLARIRVTAAADPESAMHYARWLVAQFGARSAVEWLASLPPDFSAKPVLLTMRADVAALLGDWPALRSLLERGAWGQLSPASVDFAFAARLSRDFNAPEVARRAWTQAIEDTKTSPSGLDALARLAQIWRWPEELRGVLLARVRYFPSEPTAFLKLAQEYLAARDTRGLRDLYRLFNDGSDRFDPKLQDWALLSLLTEPTSVPNEATRTLEMLHAKDKLNQHYATNYAFALFQLGRHAEACALVDRLDAGGKELPERAPYLAAIYAAAGRKDEARAALRRAPPERALLPEEVALLRKAEGLLAR